MTQSKPRQPVVPGSTGTYAVLPLRDIVVFPHMIVPLFVGRLPVLATLEDLDVDALKTILQEPKNALVKQYQRLFEMENVSLTFQEEALSLIARKAIERKTGARGLRSIMEGILLETMYDLPGLDSVEQVVIGPEVVEGKAKPLFIHGERNDQAASASA